MFVRNAWYVAAWDHELSHSMLRRIILEEPVVLFRTTEGKPVALEDRCCHRSLPLSCGTVEAAGVRCGYHGMLYAPSGQCIEVPGQDRVPTKACVKAYHIVEKNHILWIWMPQEQGAAPTREAPDYPWHDDARYKFGTGKYHYQAPWQLIHDNLLDLSHLGYVHLKDWGHGKFQELGRGAIGIDFPGFLAELERRRFGGWVVIEQSQSDVSPLQSARVNAEYLTGRGYDITYRQQRQ